MFNFKNSFGQKIKFTWYFKMSKLKIITFFQNNREKMNKKLKEKENFNQFSVKSILLFLVHLILQ